MFYQSSFENNQKMCVKKFSLIFLFLPIILAFPQKSPVEVRQLFATHLCKYLHWFSLDTLIFPILEYFVLINMWFKAIIYLLQSECFSGKGPLGNDLPNCDTSCSNFPVRKCVSKFECLDIPWVFIFLILMQVYAIN